MSERLAHGVHVDTCGSGPELVLLHGWAMHGAIWQDFLELLASRWRITVIDLPGHGYSAPLEDYSLPAVVDAVVAVAPPSAYWLGWSLGALIALGVAARHPGRVRGLVQLAGTPRFTAAPGWPGVASELLEQMAASLAGDIQATLRRFIGLQTHGMDNPRGMARRLEAQLTARPHAEAGALQGGLRLLLEEDLRRVQADFDGPLVSLLGGRDRLVPVALADVLRVLNPGARVEVIPAAAHLPFLTHPGACRQALDMLPP